MQQHALHPAGRKHEHICGDGIEKIPVDFMKGRVLAQLLGTDKLPTTTNSLCGPSLLASLSAIRICSRRMR